MAFDKLTYTKDWTESNPESPAYFPTVEYNEEQVREDLQILPDEAKDALNAVVDKLNSIVDGNSGADNIGATHLPGSSANTVQGILEEIGTAESANTVARHTHTNKALLDTYNQTNANISDAVSKKHNHSNKTLLDNITSDKVDNWEANAVLLADVSGVATTMVGADDNDLPTVRAVLDTISQTGNGDMLKAFYDTTNTGNKVDTAINAEALGGLAASGYQTKLTFDSTPTASSNNPVTSDGIKTYVDNGLSGKASSSHVHSASDITSGVLAVDRGGTGNSSVDTTPTASSTKMVTSGGVKTALDGKSNVGHTHPASDITGTLSVEHGGTGNTSVDTSPVSKSTKMVTSGGVFTALAGKAAIAHSHAAGDITSGVLSISRGGTGRSSSPSLLTNLESTDAANVLQASPRPGVTGTLPVANGGTGNTSVDTTPTADSTKMVTSGGVYTALAGKQDKAATLNLTLASASWSSSTQTVSAAGVTASNIVIVTPAPSSYYDYANYGVYCSAQGSGTLTFTCADTPPSDISVNVLIL